MPFNYVSLKVAFECICDCVCVLVVQNMADIRVHIPRRDTPSVAAICDKAAAGGVRDGRGKKLTWIQHAQQAAPLV